MTEVGRRAVVVGAGALGLSVALTLQRSGFAVTVADPVPLGGNASGVAAGMLAPAFEAALDPMSAGYFPLLCEARDLWPAFAQPLAAFGGRVDRSGALWVGDEASLAAMDSTLGALGAVTKRLTAEEAARSSPGLNAPHGAVFTPEDWRLEATAMLHALEQTFLAAGGALRPLAVRSLEPGAVALSDGARLETDVVVLATGLAPERMDGAPAELARLSPIKGQIARLRGTGPKAGPVVRAEGIYVVPGGKGALAGATMEAGIANLAVEAETVARLKGLAAGLFPEAASAQASGAAGIRSATPDGLPMVGWSSIPGVALALGARRNGWLLAPLVAQTVTELVLGGTGGRHAAMLDPLRFEVSRRA